MSFSVRVSGQAGAGKGLAPELMEWSAFGTYRKAHFSVNADQFPDLQACLAREIEVYDRFGELVWQGVISKMRQSRASCSMRWDLESLANRVLAIYHEPGAPQTLEQSVWVEDRASQAGFGIHEKVLRLGQCRGESAVELARAYLKAYAWPVARLANAVGAAETQLEARGWYESLAWRNVDLDSGLAAFVDPGTGTVGLSDCLERIFGTCGGNLAGWSFIGDAGARVQWPGWPLADGLSQLKRLAALLQASGQRLKISLDPRRHCRIELLANQPGEVLAQIDLDGRIRSLQGALLSEGRCPLGAIWRCAGQDIWVENLRWQPGSGTWVF